MPSLTNSASSTIPPTNSQQSSSTTTTTTTNNPFVDDFGNLANNDLFWQYILMAFGNGTNPAQSQQSWTNAANAAANNNIAGQSINLWSESAQTNIQQTEKSDENLVVNTTTTTNNSIEPQQQTKKSSSRKRSYRHDKDRGSKTCKECNVTYRTKEEYWVHNRQIHDDGKLNRCPVCVFSTKFKHHFDYHLRGHIRSKPYRCTKCDYRCINQSMLRSHISSHRRELRNRCKICLETFKTLKALEQHMSAQGHLLPLRDLVEIPVTETGLRMLAAATECCNKSTNSENVVQTPQNASELLNSMMDLLNKSKLTGVKEIVQDAVLDDEYADQVIVEAEMYSMNLSSHLYCDRCEFTAATKDEIIIHLKEHVEKAKPDELVIDVMDPTDGSDGHDNGGGGTATQSSQLVKLVSQETTQDNADYAWTAQPEKKHRRKEAKPVKLARSAGPVVEQPQLDYTSCGGSNGNAEKTSNAGDHPVFSCNICWISFHDACSYLTHLTLHDRDEPLRCTMCKELKVDCQKFREHPCCRQL